MKITVEFESLAEFEKFFLDSRSTIAGKTPLAGSGLDQRTIRCLQALGVKFAEEAQAMSDLELLQSPNLGRKSLAAIRSWKPAQPANFYSTGDSVDKPPDALSA